MLTELRGYGNLMRLRMKPSWKHLRSFGVSISAVLLALWLTLQLQPVLNPIVFSLFYPASIFSALYGGLEAGVLASFLAILVCKYFLLEPFYSLAITDVNQFWRICVFLTTMLLVSKISDISVKSRQKAEMSLLKLKQSEERYRHIVDTSNEGIWITDTTYRTEYVNQRLAQMLGYSVDEMLGRSAFEFIDESTRNESRKKVAQSNQPQDQFDFRYRRKDGTSLWATVASKAIFDAQGNLSARLSMVSDASAKKRAEAALRKSEARLGRLVESNLIGVVFWDASGKITNANDAFLRLVGYTRADLQSGKLNWKIMTPAEQSNLGDHAIAQMQQSGAASPIEKEYLCSDGSRIPVIVGGVMFEDSQESGVSFVIDLTERKRTEADLLRSEERYRSLVEATSQIIWNNNMDGEPIVEQKGWGTFTGQTYAEYKGLGWLDAVHSDDRKRVYQTWLYAIAKRSPYNLELRVQRYDGEYRYMLARGVPVLEPDGSVREWVGTYDDITERKQAEKEREQILEREQSARADAEAANRIKDEFLAVLSHELRTPLSPILGWAQLLQTRKFDDATTARALETIERNAKLQTQLIEDLLDVSRILRGKLRLDIHTVSLESIIEAAIETVRLAAEAKSIQIQSLLSSSPEMVTGDPNRLQQVVWNLLSNAVKFTPNGGEVTVQLTYANALAQIQVSDTGKGISAEFLPYVFEYFRQSDSTTTRSFGGLGLGLAIAHHLVELHGGTIEAESKGEGEGASFVVSLPVMSERPEKTLSVKSHGKSNLKLSGLHILVVEDEADTRELISFMLRQYGAIITTAPSASEALQILAQSKPSLLLSDIGMPDMDGYMLIRHIRSLPPEQGGQIPAIALTALASAQDQQEALLAGYQQHISKPIKPVELIAAIATLTKRDRQKN